MHFRMFWTSFLFWNAKDTGELKYDIWIFMEFIVLFLFFNYPVVNLLYRNEK